MVKIPNDIKTDVKKFKNRIQSILKIKKVFLFGSYAKGNYSNSSDIDICIIAKNIKNSYLSMLKIAPYTVDINLKIEAVVFSEKEFNEEPTYGLLKQIKETGIAF